MTPTVLNNFLEKSVQPLFSKDVEGRQLMIAALRGLHSALAVPDPPGPVSVMLCQIVTQLFNTLKHVHEVSFMLLAKFDS